MLTSSMFPLIVSRERLIALRGIGCGLGCEGSRLFQAGYFETLHDGIVIRSQRAPSKGNTSLKSGPMWSASAALSSRRARCSRVLTVSGRRPKQIGRLFDAHVLEDACDEDRAKILRQVVDGAFHQSENFALGNRALWVHGFISGEWEGYDL